MWEDSHAHLIIATRTYFGEATFSAWAWRIPFLFSFLLVFIAFYMRLQFQESPIHAEMKAKRENQQEPMAGGFPRLEHQIRAYRDHRGAGAGRGLVSEGLGVFVKLVSVTVLWPGRLRRAGGELEPRRERNVLRSS